MATLLRHGKADYRTDTLLPEAVQAVREVAKTLQGRGFKRILASPSGRAQGTAIVLAEVLGIAVVGVVPRLAEIPLDEPQELAELFARFSAQNEPGGPAAPKAAFAHAPTRERLEKTSYELLSWVQSLGDDVLVVTHGITLTGLKLAKAGKRNWNPAAWEGNGFPNLGILEIKG